MNRFFLPRSFSTRLILGAFALILLTTVSAGIPAYWLTRAQLERQAWSQVDGAQRATRSLLQAEQDRLSNLATLFAERPTLQELAREQATADLRPYLTAFREQSDLDILLFCDPRDRRLAGDGFAGDCNGAPAGNFVLIDNRPALLVYQQVDDPASGQILGSTIAGIWLDGAFLAQLAANTGVQQSVVRPDGVRLATSLPGGLAQPVENGELAAGTRRQVVVGDTPYYASYLPLGMGEESSSLLEEALPEEALSEVALPVAALAATETRALLILAGSTGLVALLGSLLGIWYMRQLVAPLQQLTAVAERIGSGELMAPIPLIASPAEVSTLATALHRSQASMLHAVRERGQARDRLNALIQSIVEGVVTVDNDGSVTFLSHGAEQLSGWFHEEALGRSLDDIFPLAGEEEGSFLDAIPAAGQKRQISVRGRTGSNIVLAVTSAQVVPPGAETAQLALVLRDVTEEEALRHLRSYFLANISHEFLTPLSTLNASMELMLNPAEALSAEEMRQLLKPSYVSLRALQTLINNLLDSSSIEAGQFTLYRQPTDLDEVLQNALLVAGPLLERRRQPIRLGEPGLVPLLNADPVRLTQVLVNLLVNASKYSPPEKPIEVSMVRDGARVRISVADRGPGIPPAERENIFRRFVRRQPQEGEQYGIGLGLFVVKTAVEAHGGRVGVSDRPGGGSIFWFELPLNHGETGR